MDDGFVVHKENGLKPVSGPSNKQIYYSDMTIDSGTVLVHT